MNACEARRVPPIFTQRQLSELVTAIKGRGEIPLKFVYLSQAGADNWNKIAENRSHEESRGINSVEGRLLSSKVDSFIASFGHGAKLNIVDIGCGNGCPVMPLLSALKERRVRFRYVPVDISREMLDLASRVVAREYPGTEIHPFVLDFEQGNFADMTYGLRADGSKNLLLFLGSTLGNQPDRHRVLSNFRDSMTSDDFMIVGVELVNLSRIEKILRHYRGADIDRFVFAAASAVGLRQEQGVFDVRFNSVESQVEVSFILEQDASLRVGAECFILEKEERLLLGRSHKFSEWIFAKVLQESGFRIELLTTSAEKGYSLVMCQPSRFLY